MSPGELIRDERSCSGSTNGEGTDGKRFNKGNQQGRSFRNCPVLLLQKCGGEQRTKKENSLNKKKEGGAGFLTDQKCKKKVKGIKGPS